MIHLRIANTLWARQNSQYSVGSNRTGMSAGSSEFVRLASGAEEAAAGLVLPADKAQELAAPVLAPCLERKDALTSNGLERPPCQDRRVPQVFSHVGSPAPP